MTFQKLIKEYFKKQENPAANNIKFITFSIPTKVSRCEEGKSNHNHEKRQSTEIENK